MGISLEQAQAAVQAAHQKAVEIGTKMNIAVVDAGGNLKAFARMDDAWLGSIDISIKKAKTARYFDMPTGEIGKLSAARRAALQHRGLQRRPDHVPRRHADQGRRGKIIGAIGVSGRPSRTTTPSPKRA